MTAKPKLGRPKPLDPGVRVNLILDVKTVEKLKKHGDGNMSLGVRLLATRL